MLPVNGSICSSPPQLEGRGRPSSTNFLSFPLVALTGELTFSLCTGSLTPQQIGYYQAHASDDLRLNELTTNVGGFFSALAAALARVLSR